jgi:hypothetical protein
VKGFESERMWEINPATKRCSPPKQMAADVVTKLVAYLMLEQEIGLKGKDVEIEAV